MKPQLMKMDLLTVQSPSPMTWSPQTRNSALKAPRPKGVQCEDDDGASMILDTGCTKAMCSRRAYLLMREDLSEGQVELLPDSSTFNFAKGQKALAREKCRIWFSDR